MSTDDHIDLHTLQVVMDRLQAYADRKRADAYAAGKKADTTESPTDRWAATMAAGEAIGVLQAVDKVAHMQSVEIRRKAVTA